MRRVIIRLPFGAIVARRALEAGNLARTGDGWPRWGSLQAGVGTAVLGNRSAVARHFIRLEDKGWNRCILWG